MRIHYTPVDAALSSTDFVLDETPESVFNIVA
jgi:hypothetical protein